MELDDVAKQVQQRADHSDLEEAGDWDVDGGCPSAAWVSDTTLSKWKTKFGELEVSDAKRLHWLLGRECVKINHKKSSGCKGRNGCRCTVMATASGVWPYFMKPRSFVLKFTRSGRMSPSALSLIPIHLPSVAAYCEAAVLGSIGPPYQALSGPSILIAGSLP
jgi:hypothetical protein